MEPDQLNNVLRKLHTAIENKTVISVTGHRDIIMETEERIKKEITEKLREIVSIYNSNVVLLTGLACGADQLVADIAFHLGIPFIALLPMRKEFFRSDFGNGNEHQKFEELFNKKQIDIVVDDLANEKEGAERNKQYETAGMLIAAYSDHLIALWDGVYSGKPGGTSEIIRLALGGSGIKHPGLSAVKAKRSKTAFIHHLLTPRISNPFPVSDPKISKFPLKELQWGNIKVPLARVSSSGKWRQFYGRYGDLLIKFLIPFFLVIITIVLGSMGFYAWGHNGSKEVYNKWDAFYASANLITLNSSILHDDGTVPLVLHLARILGLLTAVYAIIGAFLWAANDLRKKAIIFFWRKNFYLVIGLNEKSFNLVKDLRSRKINTVVLNDNINSSFSTSCKYLGAIVYNGNPTEISALNHIYFKKAKNIYVFTESDSENVRIMQQIDQHSDNEKSSFYVHISDLKQKEFLARTTKSNISIFNIYENVARRILFKHPLDRFEYNYYSSSTKKTVQLIILGFNKLAWEIAIAGLRMAHYTTDVSFEMTIFFDGEEERIRSEEFGDKYAIFFETAKLQNKEADCLVRESVKIKFLMLPQSDASLTDPHNCPIFTCVKKDASISLITCLADGLKSAACISLLLPRLSYLKGRNSLNLQVFCFYNSPYEIEEGNVEYQLNKIGAQIPVYCFGNFLRSCIEDEIKSNISEMLAKQLAFWYYLIYNFDCNENPLSESIYNHFKNYPINLKGQNSKEWMHAVVVDLKKDITLEKRLSLASELLEFFWKEELKSIAKGWWDKCWAMLPESEKASNRQAADHIFVKVRCIEKSFKITSIKHLSISEIELLAPIEHRRWCAEKLIDGWHLFEDKDDWLSEGQKSFFKNQKLHYDLRNFEKMEEYEKNKDHNQIIAIPFFLRIMQYEFFMN